MSDPYVLTTLKTTAYGCPNCSYQQNSDPYDPWQQSPDMFPTVPLGMCPSCYLARKGAFPMARLLASDITTTHDVASDEALDQIAQAEQLGATQTQALIDQRNQKLDTLQADAAS